MALSVLCPFPGTEAYDLLVKEGFLKKDLNWSKFTFITDEPPFDRLRHLSAKQLLSLQNKIIKEYYSSPKYILGQILKLRSFNDLKYFANLGWNFISEFFFRNKKSD